MYCNMQREKGQFRITFEYLRCSKQEICMLQYSLTQVHRTNRLIFQIQFQEIPFLKISFPIILAAALFHCRKKTNVKKVSLLKFGTRISMVFLNLSFFSKLITMKHK